MEASGRAPCIEVDKLLLDFGGNTEPDGVENAEDIAVGSEVGASKIADDIGYVVLAMEGESCHLSNSYRVNLSRVVVFVKVAALEGVELNPCIFAEEDLELDGKRKDIFEGAH